MIRVKINQARERICEAFVNAERFAVLWSAGKDSQLVLFLVREEAAKLGRDFAVIHLRPVAGGTRDAFANRIIREWRLNVRRLPVTRRLLTMDHSAHVNLLYQYQYNQTALHLPVEAHPAYQPNADSLCLQELFYAPLDAPLDAPLEPKDVPQFDVLFNGTRAVDTDALLDIRLNGARDERRQQAYPIWDFTDDEIWQASELLGVPQNEARYQHNDLSANADYHPICTRCLDARPNAALYVRCPKDGAMIRNAAPELAPQMKEIRATLNELVWS